MQGARRAIMEHERQQLRPGVVADRIHHALALDDEPEIEIGDQQTFAAGQRWDHVCAFGRDDRRHAPAAQRFAQLFIGRNLGDLLLREPTGGVDHEAAALERVVTDRHLDLIGEDRADHGAWKLRHMNLFMLRHQGIAGEGVVVLPTSERAEAADRGVDDREARAVALAPDHALVEGRRDLAPLQHQVARPHQTQAACCRASRGRAR